MNWRRYFMALGVTSLLTLVADILLNAIIFREAYSNAAQWLLPADELNRRVPVGWGGLLVAVAAFGFLLVRGGWLGLRSGLQFGLVLAIASLAGVAGFASMFPWANHLAVAIVAQQTVNGLLLGAVFGVIYKPVAVSAGPNAVAR